MKQMDPLVKHLRMLEAFDDLNPKPADSESELERLRAMLPTPILAHYDYRRSRSLRSLAAVIVAACGHCKSAVPTALMLQMQRRGALGICPECGGYLFVEGLGVRGLAASPQPRQTTQ